MNDGDPTETIGEILEKQFGMERYGNELLYDGTTGVQIPSAIFIGQCYTMRLKHMTEDKWNARAEGRREQRTHQPTGGRGNEGGLRIGEMERDAIVGHGISMFTRESIMKRGDGETFLICNGCGTIPIYNEAEEFYVCPLCDGPLSYAGKTVNTLELIPPNKRSLATFSKVEMPYVVKLLEQEMSTYMNIGMRYLTAKNVMHLPKPDPSTFTDSMLQQFKDMPLPDLEQEDLRVPPEERKEVEEEKDETDLAGMPELVANGEEEAEVPFLPSEDEQLEAQMEAAAHTAAAAVAASRGVESARLAEATQRGVMAAMNASVPPPQVVMPPQYPGMVRPPPPASSGVGWQPPASSGVGWQPPQTALGQAEGREPLAPLAEGAYSEAPAQIQIVQNVPLLPAGTTVLGSAAPGGQPTLIVDTSQMAMRQQGLPGFELPSAARPANLSARGSAMNRNRTQRASRAPGGTNVFGREVAAPQQQASSGKITVQKLGS
jgi:hypothetical protein